MRPERTQDGGSAAAPEVDGLPADGEAEQRLGAAAKVRTPTQLAREEHVHSGHERHRNHCERCMSTSGQGKSHPTARGNPDERSVSRRSQRRTVHQQCSRLCARMCAYVRLASALSSDEDVFCVASAGKCDRWSQKYDIEHKLLPIMCCIFIRMQLERRSSLSVVAGLFGLYVAKSRIARLVSKICRLASKYSAQTNGTQTRSLRSKKP